MISNDNPTTFYRIRRKSDGDFFVSICKGSAHRGRAGTWSPNGAFFKRIETIENHLIELCAYRMYCEDVGYVHNNRGRRRGKRQREIDDLNPFFVIYPSPAKPVFIRTMWEWLDRYEVVATHVNVLGENTISSSDIMADLAARLVKLKALKTIELMGAPHGVSK